jgi:hypothetical protein
MSSIVGVCSSLALLTLSASMVRSLSPSLSHEYSCSTNIIH